MKEQPRLLKQVRSLICVNHYSIRTEELYIIVDKIIYSF